MYPIHIILTLSCLKFDLATFEVNFLDQIYLAN